jgi:hypothetical protein
MKKLIYLSAFFNAVVATSAYAQTKIKDGTVVSSPMPDANALLELESNNKGVLFPRMTKVQRDAMTNVPEGLVVYNTTESCLNQYTSAGWASLCDNSEFCGIVMVGDNNDETFTYTNPNVTTNRIFEPNDPSNACALYITENGSTWIWNGTSYVSKSDAYVNPWFNKANNQPSKSLTDRIYHLGSVQIGTGNATGAYSLSVGSLDTVTGGYSAAIGLRNSNAGYYSLISGLGNKIYGSNAALNYIFGWNSTISGGQRNFISGYNSTISSGYHNTIFGSSNLIDGGQYGYIVGVSSKIESGNYHTIMGGINNYINGGNNCGIFSSSSDTINTLNGYGRNVTIGGNSNKILGTTMYNLVQGSLHTITSESDPTYYNFVSGQGNKLDGAWYSGVFGYSNEDSARYSFVAGQNNKVRPSADHSATFGLNNISEATYGFMAGLGLKNTGMISPTVVGRYNDPVAGAYFSVGTGSSDASRKNSFTVKSASLIMPKSASYPASPEEGEMFFHTGTKKTYVYDGSTWQALY